MAEAYDVNVTVRSGVFRSADARASIPGPAGERSVVVLRRGTLDVAFSLPGAPSRQTPHGQDEIYVIVRGRGMLVHDGKRDPFGSGDLLLVGGGLRASFRGSER